MNLPLSAIERAKLRLAERAAEIAAKQQAKAEAATSVMAKSFSVPTLDSMGYLYDNSLQWNAKQQEAISATISGKSFCLIGAAGTGKTSVTRGMVKTLLMNNMIPPIPVGNATKYLRSGTPGIAIVSFTNMAVRQVAKNFTNDITCVTIHKLLEFGPVYYEVENGDGTVVTKMRFEPARNRTNPLPRELRLIMVDESSMVDSDLFQLLMDALPNPAAVQFVFLGDLNQLPPVYGQPILGRKLLELPTIELVEVYRQALQSPIISLAHDMKNGKAIPVSDKVDRNAGPHGRVVIHPWAKRLTWEDALNKASNFCKGAIQAGELDVYRDMILCPYNKVFGVIELNLAIADWLGRKRNAVVHEVICGMEKKYLAVGDKVLVDKQEAIIVKIARNGNYSGKHPVDPNKYDLDRYGAAKKKQDSDVIDADTGKFLADDFDVDDFLNNMQTDDNTERKRQASHRITVRFILDHDKKNGGIEDWAAPETNSLEDEDVYSVHRELTTAAELNEMLFGYAITVHKSQGSEWRRVFFLTHHSHSKMCSRELMYTGMTRAREYLYIICEPDRLSVQGTLSKAANNPRLKGNTLAEKLVSLKELFEREAREALSKAKQEDE